MYDIFYKGSNDLLTKTFPFAKKAEDKIRPLTKMYWLVEENVEVIDFGVFEYRPETQDEFYEHVWKWNPENYGGVKLIPKQKSQGVKEVNKVVCKKTFDIIYQKQPGNYFEQNPNADFVWCIDKDYVLPKTGLNWAPDNYEPTYIHNFKLPYQATDKYPDHVGGLNLYPREWKNCNVKYHGIKSFGEVYPFLYVNDPEDYSQRDIYDDEFVWLIDKEYVINEDTLNWTPAKWDRKYIHSFRLPNQLQHKSWSFRHFEDEKFLGGIRLVPKKWREAQELIPGGVVIHKNCPVKGYSNYDVFYIDDPETDFSAESYEYYAARSKTDHFWLVDREYDFVGELNYVPNADDKKYIQVFKIPNSLEYRYPATAELPSEANCGGVRLVPKNFDMTKQKYMQDVLPIRYDVYYVPHEQISNYEKYQPVSTTSIFIMIDEDHVLDASKLEVVIPRHDRFCSTIYKIPQQLEYRYTSNEPWDNRCGGVHFVPKKDVQTRKYSGYINTIPVEQYPVIRVSNTNLKQISTKIHGPVWLVDSEYVLSEEVFTECPWMPETDQKEFIHNFKDPTQLLHKYPEEMGGIHWLPKNWQTLRNSTTSNLVIWGPEASAELLSLRQRSTFPHYDTLEEGMANCTDEYFWLVDSDVDVHDNFKFDYIPEAWDRQQTHVWQKCNPVTGKVYDYGGVQLVCVKPNLKKRPKFVKVAASTQKPYPVFELDPTKNLVAQLSQFSKETRTAGSSNFWCIDAKLKLANDWDFSFLPTQWEQNFVHVFENTLGNYGGVRLFPVSYVDDNPDITLSDLTYNNIPDIKYIQIVASLGAIEWPVIPMTTFNKEEFIRLLRIQKEQGYDFAWTIDSDCVMSDELKEKSFMPALSDRDKVHMWQIFSPHTNRTHSYGGVKLWPTNKSYKSLTTKEFNTGNFRDKQYVREQGGTYLPYDVVLISYHDDTADQKYAILQEKCTNAYHIKNVDGIFEAHKEAAKVATTKMIWVVDSDAELVDTFKFDYIPDMYDRETVHVWTSVNPVTADEYGYGGVKLFNRQQILDATNWGVDFTTGLSKDFKVMEEVSNITKFNTDPLSTWRSAFREAAKLTIRSDTESLQRLFKWFDPVNKDADFCEYAISGAECGYAYILENSNKPNALTLINDFEWLKKRFDEIQQQ